MKRLTCSILLLLTFSTQTALAEHGGHQRETDFWRFGLANRSGGSADFFPFANLFSFEDDESFVDEFSGGAITATLVQNNAAAIQTNLYRHELEEESGEAVIVGAEMNLLIGIGHSWNGPKLYIAPGLFAEDFNDRSNSEREIITGIQIGYGAGINIQRAAIDIMFHMRGGSYRELSRYQKSRLRPMVTLGASYQF